MFTQQTPCSITEHAIFAAKEGSIHPVRQLDRHLRTADATYLHFPLKGRTCKHLRHVSRAASEERPGLREASKLFVEGAASCRGVLSPWTAPAHSPGLKALFSQRLLCMNDAMQDSKTASMRMSYWHDRLVSQTPARCPVHKRNTKRGLSRSFWR